MSISKKEQERFDRMAAVEATADGDSERGESLHGGDVAALGQQMLLDALGSAGAVERAIVGRPRVDKGGGRGQASPTLQVRITAARKKDLERLRLQTHSKSTSDVVRAAIDEYVDRHQISA